MPKFYLHLQNGSGFTKDETGADFADAAEAKKVAITSLLEVTSIEVRSGDLNMRSYVSIDDEQHQPVMTVHLHEVLKITPGSAS